MKKLCKLISFFAFTFLLTACYRMPTENDFSLIPSTNNPNFTRESGSAMPNVGF